MNKHLAATGTTTTTHQSSRTEENPMHKFQITAGSRRRVAPALDTTDRTDKADAAPRSLLRRLSLRLGLVGVLASLLLGLAPGSAEAYPTIYAGGNYIVGGTRCDYNNRYIQVYATAGINSSAAYMYVYVQSVATGAWTGGGWHQVQPFTGATANDWNFTGHGYYRVYVYFKQWTNNGWALNGAYENNFSQGMANGTTVNSSTCYI